MKPNRLLPPVLGLFTLLTTCQPEPPVTSQLQSSGAPQPEGPFVHQNLALFLVRGDDSDTRDYITLDEGLLAGEVKVREIEGGAEVNRLEIENISNRWLFLHAGDIVQGGQQDRTIATDAIIPPQSKPGPIDAFCVEHGRWSYRGGPSDRAFGKNTGIVGSNALKLSIQKDRDQAGVWREVAHYEAATLGYLGGGEQGGARLSDTGTYNAIVENDRMTRERQAYVEALMPRVRNEKGVVGIVAAVNGVVVAADVYASSSLFRKLAPKLLDSYALQALLSRSPEESQPAPSLEAVSKFLSEPRDAAAQVNEPAPSMYRHTRETEDAILFEYGQVGSANASPAPPRPVHSSYVRKKPPRK